MLRKIELLGAEVVCDFLKDSFIFDTVVATVGINERVAFVAKGVKTSDQANFHSDGQLVQSDRILECLSIIVRPYGNLIVEEFDLKSIMELGSFVLDIDEDIEDRDVLLRLGGGVDIRTFVEPGNLGFLDRAFVGDGAHTNVRVYAKHKMMPGGKSTNVTCRWPRAGGLASLVNRDLMVAVYGYELKPRAKVKAAV